MINSKEKNRLHKSLQSKKKYNAPLVTQIGKLQNVTKGKPGAQTDSGSFVTQSFESS